LSINLNYFMFSKKKGAIIVVLCFFLPFLIGAKIDFWSQFEQNFRKFKSFGGTFKQEYYDSIQSKSFVSHGLIEYLSPGLMRWSYNKPDEMEIVIGTDRIWIYDPILDNVTIQRLDQITRMNAIGFLQNQSKLSVIYTPVKPGVVFLDSFKNHHPLFLKPKRTDAGYREIQLAVNKSNFQITQFVIIDNQSNYRKITFSDINTGMKFKPEDFMFKVKDNLEVINEFDK